MSFYFLTEFFKYFFRVLHEASSSWLKYLRNFQNHPVYLFKMCLVFLKLETKRFYLGISLRNLNLMSSRSFLWQRLPSRNENCWIMFVAYFDYYFLSHRINLIIYLIKTRSDDGCIDKYCVSVHSKYTRPVLEICSCCYFIRLITIGCIKHVFRFYLF
jgi:hypothetical protein